jgi:hypothetical protein
VQSPDVWSKKRLLAWCLVAAIPQHIFTENFLITLAAVLVGLASGIGVWAFKVLFNLLKSFYS